MTTALPNADSWALFGPQIILALGVVLTLGLGLFVPAPRKRAPAALAAATCAAAGVALVLAPAAPLGLFGGLVAHDPFARFFTALVLAATAIVAVLSVRSRDALDGQKTDPAGPEYFALLLAAALGCVLMAGAADLLMVYLAIELVSLCSYVLTGFTRGSRRAAEASLKYVLYGSVASGVMLYGMSLLYGLAASTELHAVRAAAAGGPPALVLLAVALVLAGVGYKVAIVPFHSWCPDVYEGAPTPIAAFLSVAPKAAGFAIAIRLFSPAAAPGLEGLARSSSLLLVIAVATMTFGNLGALAQTNVKRLLAYSSIAHAGYLTAAVAAGRNGGKAVAFYLAVYLFMSLAAFTAVAAVKAGSGGSGGSGSGGSGSSGSSSSSSSGSGSGSSGSGSSGSGSGSSGSGSGGSGSGSGSGSGGSGSSGSGSSGSGSGAAGEGLGPGGDFDGLGRRAPLVALALAVVLFALTGLPPTGGFVGKYYLFASLVEAGHSTGLGAFYATAVIAVLNSVVSLGYYARLLRAMYFAGGAPGRLPVSRLHTVLLVSLVVPIVLLGVYWAPLDRAADAATVFWSR